MLFTGLPGKNATPVSSDPAPEKITRDETNKNNTTDFRSRRFEIHENIVFEATKSIKRLVRLIGTDSEEVMTLWYLNCSSTST